MGNSSKLFLGQKLSGLPKSKVPVTTESTFWPKRWAIMTHISSPIGCKSPNLVTLEMATTTTTIIIFVGNQDETERLITKETGMKRPMKKNVSWLERGEQKETNEEIGFIALECVCLMPDAF